MLKYTYILADTRVKHADVLAVGSSFIAGILTFVLISLHGFNYATSMDFTIYIST